MSDGMPGGQCVRRLYEAARNDDRVDGAGAHGGSDAR